MRVFPKGAQIGKKTIREKGKGKRVKNIKKGPKMMKNFKTVFYS